jgi:sugar lactone lactonase YvrE
MRSNTVWSIGAVLLESPVIVGDMVFCVDILGNKLFRWDIGEKVGYVYPLPEQISSIAPITSEWRASIEINHKVDLDEFSYTLLCSGECGFSTILIDDRSICFLRFLNPEKKSERTRFNDGKLGPDGWFYSGTMDLQEREPLGSFYRCSPHGEVHPIEGKFLVFNGPCFHPNGNLMLASDSALGCVYRYLRHQGSAWLPDGIFKTFDKNYGSPDGMCFCKDGAIWLALWGSGFVIKLDEHGNEIVQIDTGCKFVTSCCVSNDESELFITAQSDLNGSGKLLSVSL